jgi:hypothetical protein
VSETAVSQAPTPTPTPTPAPSAAETAPTAEAGQRSTKQQQLHEHRTGRPDTRVVPLPGELRLTQPPFEVDRAEVYLEDTKHFAWRRGLSNNRSATASRVAALNCC